MFGDRIDIIVDNYETELPLIKKLLSENKVNITDERIIPPTLENVFMHLIRDAS